MKRVNLNTKMHISAPCSSRGAETRAVAAAATFIDSISLCESERFFLKQRDFFFFSETNRSIKGEAGVGKRRRSESARAFCWRRQRQRRRLRLRLSFPAAHPDGINKRTYANNRKTTAAGLSSRSRRCFVRTRGTEARPFGRPPAKKKRKKGCRCAAD